MTVCFYFHRQDFLEQFISVINKISKKNKIFILVSFNIDYKIKNIFNNENICLYEYDYLLNKKIFNLLNFFQIFSKRKRNFFQILIGFFYHYFKMKSEKKFVDSFFKKNTFDKLCIGSDREVGFGAYLIKKSKLNKKKVILLNVFSSNTSGSIVNRLKSLENICSKFDLKKFFIKKNYLLEFNGTTYIFFKLDLYFAAYFNDALVTNPWDRCYDADIIMVESKIAKQQLINFNKINSKKIVVTGIPVFDLLKKKNNKNKNKIVLHIPHLYEHGFLSYPKTINFYFRLLDKFINLKINKRILITYHPRVSKKLRKLIFIKYKNFFNFSNNDLIKNLTNAKAYISWWSTTIGWALFMKIPVISLNCFGSPINGWEEFKKNTFVVNNINNINNLFIKKVLNKNSIKHKNDRENYARIISNTILKI